ncbi:MAG: ferrous iron transport protein B [Xanthomonadaceae bacterium]|nr:ferrous iron transport protein B [Xanthomonadaceae bacterium]
MCGGESRMSYSLNNESTIALVGIPNCGKTALFNALTGSRQKVANYSGVTVEKKEGILKSGYDTEFRIIDLPGTYSLKPKTPDEEVTSLVLKGEFSDESRPHLLCVVADATALERHLPFILELKSLNAPMVVALNMMDLAREEGITIDLEKLSQALSLPVMPVVAIKKTGVKELVAQFNSLLTKNELPNHQAKAFSNADRLSLAQGIFKHAVTLSHNPLESTHQWDKVFLHPVLGFVILGSILFLMFQALFSWATPIQDLLESSVLSLGNSIGALISDGAIRSLVTDGIFAGVGSVVVFLPQIIILYFFILLLEDTGYMARAAFLMDKLMSVVGLHGRAFIPILSSYACAIPGIMATRTIENPKDRIATILIAPLTTCSARLPVYTLLIGAFIPNTLVMGFFNLRGVVMFSLYALGLAAALVVAWILKRTAFKGPIPPLFLDLPTYKRPSIRNLMYGLYERSKIFLTRAGTIILSLSVILWFLSSYPEKPIANSYSGHIGRFIEPVLKPIGFDWRVSVALIPGFAAREVMVSALATVYSIEDSDEGARDEKLSTVLSREWTLPMALSLLIWYVFAPQCISTFAVTKRETGGYKWPIIQSTYMLVLAYIMSFIVFRLSSMWI